MIATLQIIDIHLLFNRTEQNRTEQNRTTYHKQSIIKTIFLSKGLFTENLTDYEKYRATVWN